MWHLKNTTGMKAIRETSHFDILRPCSAWPKSRLFWFKLQRLFQSSNLFASCRSCPLQLATLEVPPALLWSIFMFSAWLEIRWQFVSCQLRVGRKCKSWFRSNCPRKAELLPCITTAHRSCSIKLCSSKALVKLQIYRALLSEPICALHGVLSKDSR